MPSPLLPRTLLAAVAFAALVGLVHGADAQTANATSVAVQAETETLTAADAAQGDILGYAVSLSGDRAVVGATAADPNGDASGAAYVFRQTGGGWTEEAKLVPDDAASGAYFGVAVALDGDRALVGGYHHDDKRGSATVFVRTDAGWVQEAALPVVCDAGDEFGVSVALQGDRAVVGAHRRHGGRGAATVFVRTEAGWVLDAELSAPDSAAGAFGWSVALDGDRIVVGAYEHDDKRGAAAVFDHDASGWTHRATLTAPDGDAGDNLGVSVALDGDHVLVGAPFDDERGEDSGAAYAFAYDGTGWTSTGKLTSPDGEPDDSFGWSVALHGSRALVGARHDDQGIRNGGAAFLFDRTGAEWTTETKLLGATTASASAGVSVSLSDRHALVGAPYHHGSRGVAQVFALAHSTAAAPDLDLDVPLSVAPNPVAGRARVSFGLAEAGDVRASVFDLLGREVAVLTDGPRAAGRHDVDLDAVALPAGVYVVRVTSGARAGMLRFTVAH